MAYEELDVYEEYGSDQYEAEREQYGEEDEEEDLAPKKEELEYLEIRQKLKEAARKKLARENSSLGSSCDRRMSQLGNFGSFFGPSLPSVASRVIQERKSLLETQHITSGVSRHQKDSAKSNNVPNLSAPKNGMSDRRPVDPMKNKVQKIKNTRDYSFLSSDDADIPAAPKNSSSVSNPVTRTAQVPLKSKECSQILRKPLYNIHEERRAVPRNSNVRPPHNQLTQKVSSSLRPDSRIPDKLLERKRLPSNSHASGRPGIPKDISTKTLEKKTPFHMEKKAPVHIEKKVGVTSMQRRQPDGRPVVKQFSSASVRSTGNNVQRAPIKPPNGFSRNPKVERQAMQESSKGNLLSKPSGLSSKSQVIRPPKPHIPSQRKLEGHMSMPKLQIPSKRKLEEGYRSKPKPKQTKAFADQDEDVCDFRNEIRKMFGYNPNRYANDDDDLSDMEADFRTIQSEEKRSARIAREEDERELKLIEEEEERERRRKKRKRCD